jgi:YidC/Oxa1 family membrane protein insertase
MNEKFGKIFMFAIIMIAGMTLMQMCNSKGGGEDRRLSSVVAERTPVDQPGLKADTIVLGMAQDKATGKYSFADTRYKVGVTVSTEMAGVEQVLLNPEPKGGDSPGYSEHPKPRTPLKLMAAVPGKIKPLSVMGMKLDGVGTGRIDFGPLLYKRVWFEVLSERKTDAAGVITSVTLSSWIDPVTKKTTWYHDYVKKEIPLGSLVRTYSIKEGSFDVDVTTHYINETGKQVNVTIDQMGSVNLPNDSLMGPAQYVHAAKLNGNTNTIEPNAYQGADLTIVNESFHKENAGATATGEKLLGKINGQTDKLVWTAQCNRFFAVVVRPEGKRSPKEDGKDQTTLGAGGIFYRAEWIDAVSAMPLDVAGNLDQIPVGVYFAGASTEVPAGTTMEFPMKVYMGPKKHSELDGDVKAATGSEPYLRGILGYHKIISFQQACNWCVFDWLVFPIGWLLELFHTVVGNYGVAILLLTIVVRLALHPLTRYGQTKMAEMQKKMAAIAPEVEKVKKRYEKDKKQQQIELMRVYRENNVNPASGIMGCLPLMAQTPVWAALNTLLATSIALRHAPFIPGWINDLSNPDMLFKIQTTFHFPLLGVTDNGLHFVPINLLPIILCVLYFFSMKMSMANVPKSTDPTQAQTMKIQKWMFLLFPVILYNQPSGFNLYMVASTVGGMLDTWLIRKSLRKKGILPAAMATPM